MLLVMSHPIGFQERQPRSLLIYHVGDMVALGAGNDGEDKKMQNRVQEPAMTIERGRR